MEENIIPPSPATSKSGRLRADDKDKKQDKNKTNEKDDEGSEIVEAEDDEEEDDDENRSEEDAAHPKRLETEGNSRSRWQR